MKRLLPAAVGLSLLCGAARSDPLIVETGPLVVSVTEGDCVRLVPHRPAADVEFRPGFDVAGRPVVPADLPGSTGITLPEVFAIPIEVPLAGRYPRSGRAGPVHGTVEAGVLTLEGDRLLFNGQPLTAADESALMRACRDVRR